MQPKHLFLLSALAGAIILVGGGIQADRMLKSVGVTDVLAAVSLSDSDKVNLALYLTLIASSTATSLWAGATALKGYTRRGRAVAYAALASGLGALALPTVQGYPQSILGFTVTISGLAVIALAASLFAKVPGVEVEAKAWLDSREIALVAVFSALTAILTGMTGLMLPTPTGGYTHIGDTAIYVAALLFGAKVGGCVGIIGPVAADLLVGYPRWFVTVLAHGSQGFIAGLGKGKNKVTQVVLLAVSGVVMSTVYFFVNIFIKGVPIALISLARDLFGQSLVSIILGLVMAKAVEKALPAIMK
jgi:uncharacterized membrane protein